MVTSMAALTLEIYYRYLPLYQVKTPGIPGAPEAAPAGDSGPESPPPDKAKKAPKKAS